MRRVAFLTYEPSPAIASDDRLALPALGRRGIEAVGVPWERAEGGDYDALILRSCWNYHLHQEAFRAWLDRCAGRGVRLLNPAAAARWNLHKGHLLELAEQGVRTPETALVQAGRTLDWGALRERFGGAAVVVKPAVSMSAFETHRLGRLDDWTPGRMRALLDRCGDLLVQRFVEAVLDEGELSLMYFGGRFSHAIRKTPAAGDFRSQEDFGGHRAAVEPPPYALAAAGDLLPRLPPGLLYARIDGVASGGVFWLMEVEIIDPMLFFAFDPGSADRFAEALEQALG